MEETKPPVPLTVVKCGIVHHDKYLSGRPITHKQREKFAKYSFYFVLNLNTIFLQRTRTY